MILLLIKLLLRASCTTRGRNYYVILKGVQLLQIVYLLRASWHSSLTHVLCLLYCVVYIPNKVQVQIMI